MDTEEVRAAFDAQVRQHPVPTGPDDVVERDGRVVRVFSPHDGWSGVSWSDLDTATADAVIAAQVDRFARPAQPWEWKHYSYDRPADLPGRLAAAGLVAGPAEAMMVAEIADLALDVPPPVGVHLAPVVDDHGVDAVVRVHDDVFGGDHSGIGSMLRSALSHEPASVVAVIAWSDGAPVAAGRVELPPGTEFAGIWGGGTLPAWRGRGIFRSMVTYRAALAAARGFRYLQVDASADSRPILRRLGFVELATTTPFVHLG
jgi:GNAT superfamily N-acetyltransferase